MFLFETLYHVSPNWNEDSIKSEGISPYHSEGKRKVSWYCDVERLSWALAHVSQKRGIAVSNVLVFVATIPTDALRRTRWIGVYTVNLPVIPVRVKTPVEMLAMIERGMFKAEIERLHSIDSIPF